MMFWYGHGMSGWGWVGMTLSMILFWALIITAGILLYRALSSGSEHSRERGAPARPSPEEVLAERFARGEIDEEEYRRRLTTLRGSGGLPPRP